MDEQKGRGICHPAHRPEEEFARQCLQNALGVPVCRHDDGSEQGMYDLAINYPRRPVVPVAVSSHLDDRAMRTRATLSRKLQKGVWPAPSLTRAWGLHTKASPPLKELHAKVEQCLGVLEEAGITSFDLSSHQKRQITHARAGDEIARLLKAEGTLLNLGVHRANSYESGSAGPVIRLHLERGQWAWNGSADAVVTWIGDFMADPAREDNLRQLSAAASGEAHLAVYADMSIDGNVWRALSDWASTGVVPTIAPTLVPPVTHLWLFSDPPGTTGLAWDPHRGWYRFSCVLPGEATVQG
jgi:hypothetical protein